VRAVSLHPDVLVVTSRVWQTTCTIVRAEGGEDAQPEAFLIDSPVYPDELEILPALMAQAGFVLSGLLATHGDWDHLLGRLAFPDAALGCAEMTAGRLAREPGAAQRALRDFDDEQYVARARPLSLGAVQALPVPGGLDVGARELELIPTPGHTGDGMAIWAPWAGVLAVGDYLSAVEIPTFGSGGALEDYLATLDRLHEPLSRAEHVVPGHGPVLERERALEVLEEDAAYLRALRAQGAPAPLPRARRSSVQRRHHDENVATLGR
jgi:glyoxylase-like metal-dependent hydrolase (beta-lactamase superfamily II)